MDGHSILGLRKVFYKVLLASRLQNQKFLLIKFKVLIALDDIS